MKTRLITIGDSRRPWRLVAWLLAILTLGSATPVLAACSAPATLTDPLGTYSVQTVRAGATGYLSVPGGFTCTSANLLTLLGTNYLRVTVDSAAVLEIPSLTKAGSPLKPIATIPYSLAIAATGTPALTPGTTVYLINGTTLNLLGLLGNNAMNVPIFIKPQSTADVPAGNYQGTVKLKWEWRFCSLIEAAGICLGNLDADTVTTNITFTLTVGANKAATIAITSATTWDPVAGTNFPKAIPLSKARLTMTVTNPDLVPLAGTVLILPTPSGLAVALDGDGTAQTGVVRSSQGRTDSSQTIGASDPQVTGSTVEYSDASSGDIFTYTPTPGDALSQGAVKRVRFTLQGSVGPQSWYSISMPYLVK